LIPVSGTPLLDLQLRALKKKKVNKIYLAAGFLADKIQQHIDQQPLKSKITMVVEQEPLGTGGALLNLLQEINWKISDPFLILNGDSIILPWFKNTYQEYFDWIDETHLILYEDIKTQLFMFTTQMYSDLYDPLIIFNGVIGGIGKRTTKKSWINCGWCVVKHSFFSKFKKLKGSLNLESDLITPYFRSGKVAVPLYINQNEFIEVGTLNSIKKFEPMVNNWLKLGLI
jgi:NDP-sugar pyrophosphorylase family protein